MTVGPACDARAKRAAARAERLQTSTVDETLADIARGADPVSGGESSEDGASDDDDSVDGGATPGGSGSEWRSRGRRKRDLSAQGKFKCQHLPDVLPDSCKATSKFCDKENPLWAKLGLTNIPYLAETSRKKGGENWRNMGKWCKTAIALAPARECERNARPAQSRRLFRRKMHLYSFDVPARNEIVPHAR